MTDIIVASVFSAFGSPLLRKAPYGQEQDSISRAPVHRHNGCYQCPSVVLQRIELVQSVKQCYSCSCALRQYAADALPLLP
jgi:hypothetical protein